MKKALAYIRFSNEEQGKGSTIKRQRDEITAHVKRNNLEWRDIEDVDTFTDDGLSASKGDHLSGGKLGRLMAEIDAGKYRGSVLVVEKLDRFSRLGIDDTWDLSRRVKKGGLELHLAKAGRVAVSQSKGDIGTTMTNVAESYMDEMYSANLSERVGKAWALKKANAANGIAEINGKKQGIPMTRNTPGWLKIEGRVQVGNKIVEPGRFVEIPEMVRAVRDTFAWASQGLGCRQISRRLISRRLNGPNLSISWVTKTLKNRAVLGWYVPAKGEPVADYFPAIIDQKLFDAARAVAVSKRRDGHYVAGDNRHAKNLFTGLLYDLTAKRSMYYQYGSRGSYIRNDEHSLRYDRFEAAFLRFLTVADWKEIAGETESDEQRATAARLTEIENELGKTKHLVEVKTAAADEETDVAASRFLAAQIGRLEARVLDLEGQKNASALILESAKSKNQALHTPEEMLKLVGQPDLRLRLRAEIRRRIARIDFDFSQGKLPVVFIWFINGSNRALDFRSGEAIPATQRSWERGGELT